MSYGWLKGNKTMWAGGAGGGALMYDYGAPSGAGGNNSSTDVKCQFLFDEASGDLVDEIASVTVPDVGSPTYSVAAAGAWSNLGPGITTSDNNYFNKESYTAEMSPAKDDAVFEYVTKCADTTDDTQELFQGYDAADGWQLRWQGLQDRWFLYLEETGGSGISSYFNMGGDYADGNIHHIRITMDRDGNAEMFLDGVSKGTNAIGAIDGLEIKAQLCQIGGASVLANYGFNGTIYEFRFTRGNLTNYSWP